MRQSSALTSANSYIRMYLISAMRLHLSPLVTINGRCQYGIHLNVTASSRIDRQARDNIQLPEHDFSQRITVNKTNYVRRCVYYVTMHHLCLVPPPAPPAMSIKTMGYKVGSTLNDNIAFCTRCNWIQIQKIRSIQIIGSVSQCVFIMLGDEREKHGGSLSD